MSAFKNKVFIFLLFLVGWALLTISPGTAADQKMAEFYLKRGSESLEKGQRDEAIADFTKAIQINPRDAEAYLRRGAAYSLKGQEDRAISDYNQAIQISPRFTEAYHNRGLAYKAKGQLDQAITDFSQAIRINPGSPWLIITEAAPTL